MRADTLKLVAVFLNFYFTTLETLEFSSLSYRHQPSDELSPMRMTKHTNYGIKILIECARANGEALRIAEIVERNGLTVQHGLKIAHALMKSGFVINQRGRIGGIRLARPAEEIRVGDVVRALETTNLDQSGEMPVPQVFDAAFLAFLGVLDEHTIADFAREMKQPVRSKPAAKGPRTGLTNDAGSAADASAGKRNSAVGRRAQARRETMAAAGVQPTPKPN